MSKTFPETDNGCMYGLSMGTTQMSHGWVIDESLLPYIKKYDSGIYRLTNGKSKLNREGQRMNIREEIICYWSSVRQITTCTKPYAILVIKEW
jgi:hypothetical protein